jgi:glycerol kinase
VPPRYLLALDAGTTGNRAILFDDRLAVVARAYRELPQSFPRPGWVEHDPAQILQGCLAVLREALSGIDPARVAALGITNQRETALVWDRSTGEATRPAIVWQDRRTADACAALKEQGLEERIRRQTGLMLDPYFSATKWQWMFRAQKPAASEIVGTVDSWLLFHLSGGLHATDPSNASRTLLFDLERGAWDEDLCGLFEVPMDRLPEIRPSCGDFGRTRRDLVGAEIPIAAVAGDQQAALFGQGAFRAGRAKNTYGTGLFLMAHTGRELSRVPGLLTTVAWRIGEETEYALEASAFSAGAAIQWLRDGLRFFATSEESEALAQSVPDCAGISFVPALTGLGAPHWSPRARGAFTGLTRGATAAHLTRAALESMAYQTRELLDCLPRRPDVLRVDGGATRNDFLMQLQADVAGIAVERGATPEVTALGAAALAGLSAGVFSSRDSIGELLRFDRVFHPSGPREELEAGYRRWLEAVSVVVENA